MIEFRNVVKKFGEKTVLSDLSFQVQEGEILFILGTSGTGKSVLLKNLVGLMRPTSGEIWIDGTEVSGISEEAYTEVRRNCGMVFQHPALFDSMTVYDNIAFGLRKQNTRLSNEDLEARVAKMLRLVHLDESLARKFPAQLSYGMQKRVSLARTLALRPRTLLFDEPTTGLDPVTTRAINHLILELSRKLKTTSLVVSHDMFCALEIADRIIVLDDGCIVAEGTPEALRRSEVPLVKEFLQEALEIVDGQGVH